MQKLIKCGGQTGHILDPAVSTILMKSYKKQKINRKVKDNIYKGTKVIRQ